MKQATPRHILEVLRKKFPTVASDNLPSLEAISHFKQYYKRTSGSLSLLQHSDLADFVSEHLPPKTSQGWRRLGPHDLITLRFETTFLSTEEKERYAQMSWGDQQPPHE